jgi:hypothetical protein
MNLIKFFLITTFFGVVSFLVQAQNVKPKFKKLVLVSYRSSGKKGAQSIIAEGYREIDENGVLHYKKKIYRNDVADTSYRVSDDLINDLNEIFDGKRKLKSHMITDKLPEGMVGYAGPLEYITYTDYNDKSDNLIIYMPFMDERFTALMNKIYRLEFPKKPRSDNNIISETFQNQITKDHNACKYVPSTEMILMKN